MLFLNEKNEASTGNKRREDTVMGNEKRNYNKIRKDLQQQQQPSRTKRKQKRDNIFKL